MRLVPLLPFLFVACGPARTKVLEPSAVAVPEHYEFDSRFAAGDSVGYGARVTHHLRIQDLVHEVRILVRRIESESLTEDRVATMLEAKLAADAGSTDEDRIGLTTEPPTLQSSYVALSGSASSLATELGTADAAIARGWLARVAANVGRVRPSPFDRTSELPPHVTDEGVDVGAYLEAFLDGATATRGGVTTLLERLDDDNEVADDGRGFTALEHAWDQAFGHFGASRYYGTFPLRRLAVVPFSDVTEDRRIDLMREYNFGAAVRSAARDSDVEGTFVPSAWDGFRRGRALITAANGPLGADYRAALETIRDDLVEGWERELAASVVHGFNEVLGVVCVCGDDNFVYGHAAFLEQGTAWGDLAGRLDALERHPTVRLTATDFASIRAAMRSAPYHPTSAGDPENTAYQEDLRRARARMAEAYGFDARQIGDAGGDGGW